MARRVNRRRLRPVLIARPTPLLDPRTRARARDRGWRRRRFPPLAGYGERARPACGNPGAVRVRRARGAVAVGRNPPRGGGGGAGPNSMLSAARVAAP